MTPSLFARSCALLFALVVSFPSLAAAQAPAQAPAQEPYEPRVGQPGKDVVWVPNPDEMVERMLDFASVGPNDVVIDLGSGDGRNVIGAAKRGARARGVEFNPDLVEYSRRQAAKAGVADRATFVEGDMFEADISDATVMVLFLLPDNLRRLRPKMLDLKPGTRIVANTFGIEDWAPDETKTYEDGCTSWCTIMLWIVPAKVAGTWKTPAGELKLEQDVQKVTGTLEAAPIADGKLRGDEISFTASGVRYTGRVNGNTITGIAKGASGEQKFSATRGND